MASDKAFNIKKIDLSNPSEEDLKRFRSKSWRVNHLYKVTNKEAQLVPFKQNRAQQHFALNKSGRDIVLKSRQLGFTTDACIDLLDDTLFTRNFHSLLIAQDDPKALDLFDNKVYLPFLHFPLKENYGVDTDRANKLKVDFGDDIFSEIAVKSSGRSDTLNRVHISEFGKICAKYPFKAKEIITGTFPAVPLGGRICIESTAEGDSGSFHDMFWEGWNRESTAPLRPTEFKSHFYNWQWDDEEIKKITKPDSQIPKEFKDYQQKHNEFAKKFPTKYQPITDIQLTYYFYKWLSLEKKWKLLLQEYPTTPEEAFISSGDKIFDTQKIDEYLRNARTGDQQGDWVIFEEPKQGHIYVMGVDPAGGDGRHHSAAVIWDFFPKRAKPAIVATYKSNQVAPDMLAFELAPKARHYNMAVIAPERNNHGYAFITQLKHIYPIDQIFKFTKTDKEEDKETDKLGFDMNLATKPKIVYDMVTATREDLVEIPSKAFLTEARSFTRKEAQNVTRKDDDEENQTNHFDLLIAGMIGFHVRDFLDLYMDTEVQIVSHTQTKQNLNSAI